MTEEKYLMDIIIEKVFPKRCKPHASEIFALLFIPVFLLAIAWLLDFNIGFLMILGISSVFIGFALFIIMKDIYRKK